MQTLPHQVSIMLERLLPFHYCLGTFCDCQLIISVLLNLNVYVCANFECYACTPRLNRAELATAEFIFQRNNLKSEREAEDTSVINCQRTLPRHVSIVGD